ncbi:MAG: transcriptional regulator [Candidatus Magasanikbacteria bacterium GW2011_GWA2_37_8]|uniref:Transcriptional regulator n=1 Tax=Candidatus Magasanikbacteria bacterium GW2011_GWA2_37_8 TaxID=1619036 RepID=A0A0G0JU91_9BACT|nr:MAG: transcriptional regulator [Candidatus Magasanikbacteria bacterium GW2011_GWA2_37_8]
MPAFAGVTSLGERGQIVIPKELRDHLKFKTGDKFLVLEHFGKLILVPDKVAHQLVKHLTKEFDKI